MSKRLRELQRRLRGTELTRVGLPTHAIRIPLDDGALLLVRDEIDEWVIDYYVSERAEPWTMRLPAPVEGDASEIGADNSRGAVGTMGVMGRGDDLGQVPEGYKWCEHCNGYGSSLKDGNDRCAKCNGTGLVAADRSGEAAATPANGSDKRRPTSPS